MTPGFLPPILGDILTTLVLPLLGIIYNQLITRIENMESRAEKANETLTVFSASMSAAQSKAAYLEKQLDAIFEMLREIRDEMKHKQDKTH
jgi:uncharacterized coiled-coil protein SlyX